LAAENLLETFNDSSHLLNKCCTSTEQNSSDVNSKDTSIFDVSNSPFSFSSLYRHHDTTNFFYRPYLSKMTDVNVNDNDYDSVALHKKKYRTNLRNAELSKHTFRIFLEKQILSHVEIEIQKNIQESQTPLTPNFNFDENDFTSNKIRLRSPFQTIVSEKKSFRKNNLTLPNLEAKMRSSNRAIKITNVIVNRNTDSKINVYENLVQNKSKISALPSDQNTSNSKMNIAIDKHSNYASIYANSPEWFQDNETVSVHGSLLSEAISDISTYDSDVRRNTNHKRCRWKRILFCCVN